MKILFSFLLKCIMLNRPYPVGFCRKFMTEEDGYGTLSNVWSGECGRI